MSAQNKAKAVIATIVSEINEELRALGGTAVAYETIGERLFKEGQRCALNGDRAGALKAADKLDVLRRSMEDFRGQVRRDGKAAMERLEKKGREAINNAAIETIVSSMNDILCEADRMRAEGKSRDEIFEVLSKKAAQKAKEIKGV